MTMGVGMILDNTVMLWADGRLGRFGKPGDVVTDDEDKIITIDGMMPTYLNGVYF